MRSSKELKKRTEFVNCWANQPNPLMNALLRAVLGGHGQTASILIDAGVVRKLSIVEPFTRFC